MTAPRAAPKKLVELTDGDLADRWGALKARGDDAEEKIKAVKEEFERRKLEFARGEKWKVAKDVSSQTRFDVKAARAALGKDAAKYEAKQPVTKYLVRQVEAAA